MWVRGYGLVDSAKVETAPGKIVNLTAVAAPNAAAAAEYYPAASVTCGSWLVKRRQPCGSCQMAKLIFKSPWKQSPARFFSASGMGCHS